MKLSVVATLYRAPKVIPELVDRLKTICHKIAGTDFEIILVDDGCPLGSGRVAEELIPWVSQLRVVTLSRNFGQHKACLFGLEKTRGDWVFLMDGDLDEDPEWLDFFWSYEERESNDVIFGYQGQRRGGFWDSFTGALAYRMINAFSGLQVPKNLVTARLMSRAYLDALVAHRDQVPWLAGLFVIAGFRQVGLEVRKKQESVTSWSFRSKAWQLFLALTSFSSRPMRLFGLVGVIVFMVGIGISSVALFRWMTGDVLEGWTSLLISVWLIGGLVLLGLGLLGHYVTLAIAEAKERPLVIVSRDTGAVSG